MSQLLKARIATLIAKKECDCYTPLDEVCRLLQEQYIVEPSREKVEEYLTDIWYDLESESIVEIEESFFEGY